MDRQRLTTLVTLVVAFGVTAPAANAQKIYWTQVGELPLNMQMRLLRVLQEREVQPVSSEELFPREARLISIRTWSSRSSCIDRSYGQTCLLEQRRMLDA